MADRTLLVTTAYPIYDDFWAMAKGERRMVLVKQVGSATFWQDAKLPAEPNTLVSLFDAHTVNEVRTICRRSSWMAKQPASTIARCLPMFAKQFLDAKLDRHYPASDRKSSIPKQFWFLARALAGAMYGLSARRSMNIIGPGRPEEIFDRLTPEYVVRFRPSPSRSRKRKKNHGDSR